MKRRLIAALASCVTIALMTTGTPVAHSATAGDPTQTGTGVSPAIIGGKPGSELYRFHASLQWREQGTRPSVHRCGGALIAVRWVVTAAHCLFNFAEGQPHDPALQRVRIGSNDYLSGGETRTISSFVIHPDWKPEGTAAHDIGLIELSVGSRVKPITSILHPNEEAVRMIGWGRTVNGDPASIPRQVQEVDSKLLLFKDCKFGDEFDITPGDVCVELPNGGKSGACNGDSGSPLLWKVNGVWRIVGVDSRSGAAPGCLNTPEVYSTTDAHIDWINEVINAERDTR